MNNRKQYTMEPRRPGGAGGWLSLTSVLLALVLGVGPMEGLAKTTAGRPAFIPGVADMGHKPTSPGRPTIIKPPSPTELARRAEAKPLAPRRVDPGVLRHFENAQWEKQQRAEAKAQAEHRQEVQRLKARQQQERQEAAKRQEATLRQAAAKVEAQEKAKAVALRRQEVQKEAKARETRYFKTQQEQARQARQVDPGVFRKFENEQWEKQNHPAAWYKSQLGAGGWQRLPPTDKVSLTAPKPQAPSTPQPPSKPSFLERMRHVEGKALRWSVAQPVGFVRGVGEGVVGMGQGLATMGRLSPVYGVINPQGQRRQIEELIEAGRFAGKHPGEFLQAMANWEDLKHGRVGEWVGNLAPDIVLEVATGGSGELAVGAARGTRAAEQAITAAEAARKAEQAVEAAEAVRRTEQAVKAAEAARRAEPVVKAAETGQKAERVAQAAEAAPKAEPVIKVAEAGRRTERVAQAAQVGRRAERVAKAPEAARRAERGTQVAQAGRRAERGVNTGRRGSAGAARGAAAVQEARGAGQATKAAEAGRGAERGAKVAEQSPRKQDLVRWVNLGRHAATEQMPTRKIAERMIEVALRKGTRYWDPKNKSIVYILERGFASDKSLLVAQNPFTKKITTVIRGNKLTSSRFVPINPEGI